MTQTAIPFIFMRGGTSRGPYFNRSDLPEDRTALAEVLIAAVGSGHPLNIDGIGGGNAVTTKVAMLSRSQDEWADIDYFFAQVTVQDRLVDFKPTCGNMLSGVGPAALEMGLIAPTGDETEVRIRAVNTGAEVLAKVQTPGGMVEYAGETAIDGVPGTAAPVARHFMKIAGSSPGAVLPTGNRRDEIAGSEVPCRDVGLPAASASPLAALTPISSEPASPGPWVTAMPSSSCSSTSASLSACRTTGTKVVRCSRDAIPGTMPP